MLTYFPVLALDNHIHGIGYGNQGLRSSSIVSCPDGIHYFRDSNLEFDTLFSNINNFHTVNGSWQMSFKSIDESNTLFKKGYVIKSVLNEDNYIIIGKEIQDDVCKDTGNIIILSGKCAINYPIQYISTNGEKIGSTIPLKGEKFFFIVGSYVKCS